MKKQQRDTDIAVIELPLGRTVKAAHKRKWLEVKKKKKKNATDQHFILSIVLNNG